MPPANRIDVVRNLMGPLGPLGPLSLKDLGLVLILYLMGPRGPKGPRFGCHIYDASQSSAATFSASVALLTSVRIACFDAVLHLWASRTA